MNSYNFNSSLSYKANYINQSIVKWPGGKRRELTIINKYLPKHFVNYYEPFVGGGICYLNIEAEKYFINDKCEDLINLYSVLQLAKSSEFLQYLSIFDDIWQNVANLFLNNCDLRMSGDNDFTVQYLMTKILSIESIKQFCTIDDNVLRTELYKRFKGKIANIARLNKLSQISDKDFNDNIEAAVKSAIYNYARYLMNYKRSILPNTQYLAIYFFIRDMAYSGMFRYCRNGNFNVPYGGIGYNRKRFVNKIEYLKSDFIKNRLKHTQIYCGDFDQFFQHVKPAENDFIFLDPPYDTEFSTYSQSVFDKNDQARLADYLINDCKSPWLMIIKSTDFIDGLYSNNNLQIIRFDKTYQASFQGRNDRKSTHILVKNYE